MSKIYFASDFHLGAPSRVLSREREYAVCEWLEYAANNGATEIYLLGDIFDFWFEYKHVVPKGFVRLLNTLQKLTDKEISVTIFKGNHDMWMFGYLEEECGVKTVSNELIIEKNGKRAFLHHGDGLGPGDKLYKLLKKFFRSPFCQWLFARLHPNFGISLALFWSRRSRISQIGRYEKYLGDDKEYLTRFCSENAKNYDLFIMGHRHIPLNIEISKNTQYINLGEWVNHRTYAVWDLQDNSIQLLKWE